MILAGQLSRTSLGDLLGALHRGRANGVLVLEETALSRAGASHAIHIQDGRPTAVASEGPRLGELMRERGDLDREQLAEAVRRQRRGDVRLVGELLRDLGADPEAIEATLERQTRQRLEPLYALPEARVRFHAALFADVVTPTWIRAARSSRPLPPTEFLHGRPRNRPREASAEDARREAYRALGLEPPVDPATLRTRFKQRVLELHPDRAADETDRAARTKLLARVTAAYQLLAG